MRGTRTKMASFKTASPRSIYQYRSICGATIFLPTRFMATIASCSRENTCPRFARRTPPAAAGRFDRSEGNRSGRPANRRSICHVHECRICRGDQRHQRPIPARQPDQRGEPQPAPDHVVVDFRRRYFYKTVKLKSACQPIQTSRQSSSSPCIRPAVEYLIIAANWSQERRSDCGILTRATSSRATYTDKRRLVCHRFARRPAEVLNRDPLWRFGEKTDIKLDTPQPITYMVESPWLLTARVVDAETRKTVPKFHVRIMLARNGCRAIVGRSQPEMVGNPASTLGAGRAIHDSTDLHPLPGGNDCRRQRLRAEYRSASARPQSGAERRVDHRAIARETARL